VNYNPITGNAAQQGILKPVTGTNPAAGAEISETVPAGQVVAAAEPSASCSCRAPRRRRSRS
jgi:hypothetical protein